MKQTRTESFAPKDQATHEMTRGFPGQNTRCCLAQRVWLRTVLGSAKTSSSAMGSGIMVQDIQIMINADYDRLCHMCGNRGVVGTNTGTALSAGLRPNSSP